VTAYLDLADYLQQRAERVGPLLRLFLATPLDELLAMISACRSSTGRDRYRRIVQGLPAGVGSD